MLLHARLCISPSVCLCVCFSNRSNDDDAHGGKCGNSSVQQIIRVAAADVDNDHNADDISTKRW